MAVIFLQFARVWARLFTFRWCVFLHSRHLDSTDSSGATSSDISMEFGANSSDEQSAGIASVEREEARRAASARGKR